jgi:hypothetical protein
VSSATVPGAVIDPPQGSRPSHLSNASLGQVLDTGRHLVFVYHREAFAREYRFDEAICASA